MRKHCGFKEVTLKNNVRFKIIKGDDSTNKWLRKPTIIISLKNEFQDLIRGRIINNEEKVKNEKK